MNFIIRNKIFRGYFVLEDVYMKQFIVKCLYSSNLCLFIFVFLSFGLFVFVLVFFTIHYNNNTFNLFGPYWAKGKLAQLSFYENENLFSCLFGHNIISNGLYQAIKNKIVAKKTTEASFSLVQYEPKKHQSVKSSTRN